MTREKMPIASEFMRTKLVTVGPDQEIEKAVRELARKGHSGAPVVNAEGELQGVLSEHDCIRVLVRAIAEGAPSGNVGHHMTKEVETVEPTEDLLALSTRFTQGRHRRLLVVDNGRLVGLISRRDLMSALEKFEREIDRIGGKSTYDLIDERHRALD